MTSSNESQPARMRSRAAASRDSVFGPTGRGAPCRWSSAMAGAVASASWSRWSWWSRRPDTALSTASASPLSSAWPALTVRRARPGAAPRPDGARARRRRASAEVVTAPAACWRALPQPWYGRDEGALAKRCAVGPYPLATAGGLIEVEKVRLLHLAKLQRIRRPWPAASLKETSAGRRRIRTTHGGARQTTMIDGFQRTLDHIRSIADSEVHKGRRRLPGASLLRDHRH